MSFDGVVLRAVVLELQEKIAQARIDKIYQPTKSEIYLHLRQPGHTWRLLLSAHPQEAGIYLTTQAKDNPPAPPLFCMVLRKHLEGAKILSFKQEGLDRVLILTCECLNEMGDKVLRQVILEIMGKHSNIILVDPEQNKVIDSSQRVTPAISRYRVVLPGQVYQPPPPQDKILPWEAREESFFERIMQANINQSLGKVLLSTYSGLSPQTIAEIIYRAGLKPENTVEFCGLYELRKLWQVFDEISQNISRGRFSPEVVLLAEQPLAFSAIRLHHISTGEHHVFSSMNEALDYYFTHKKANQRKQQKAGALLAIVKKEIERCEKKAFLQQQTVDEAKDADSFRLWGELLMSYQHSIPQGPAAEVPNFYDPEGKTEVIPLDSALTVNENAQKYFNKYQKLKNAARQAEHYLQETQDELAYLHSLSTSVESAENTTDLEEIADELKEAGYIKTPPPPKGKRKPADKTAVLPGRIVTDGWEIYYGKNNRQNDLLTMKIARPEDTWLHAKDIPGAHVVVRSKSQEFPPDQVLEKAALVAAYFSQARHSTNVPVDYTKRKHVWKQKGAKPGLVLYENQRTVFVTPGEDVVKTLLEK